MSKHVFVSVFATFGHGITPTSPQYPAYVTELVMLRGNVLLADAVCVSRKTADPIHAGYISSRTIARRGFASIK